MNKAPKTTWRTTILACGTRRQRLHVNGVETPFFIDSANGISAHKSQGDEHGLYGAGMGPVPSGQKYGLRIAACLGSGGKVQILKHRAEQMAMADADCT